MRPDRQHEQNNMGRGEKRMRTLVVDDSPLFLQTICSFLESLETIEVVGSVMNGRQALEQAEALQPDLVLMDLQMPEMNGLEATLQLRRLSPSTRIIIVSMHDSPEVRSACQAAGAHGSVPKQRMYQELPAEIRRIFPDS